MGMAIHDVDEKGLFTLQCSPSSGWSLRGIAGQFEHLNDLMAALAGAELQLEQKPGDLNALRLNLALVESARGVLTMIYAGLRTHELELNDKLFAAAEPAPVAP